MSSAKYDEHATAVTEGLTESQFSVHSLSKSESESKYAISENEAVFRGCQGSGRIGKPEIWQKPLCVCHLKRSHSRRTFFL